MADNQELVEVLRHVVDQHVQANPPVAAAFTAAFGDGVDSATQWLNYQLTNNAGEIARILATITTGSPAAASPEQAGTSAGSSAGGAVDAIVQEALAAVPGAEDLSQDEIDRILLEVLSEEEG